MRTVKDILHTKGDNVKTIEQNQPVYDAIVMMAEDNIGCLVVMTEGEMVGVMTERDYACKVAVKGKSSKDTPVSDIMTEKVIVAKRDTTINECMALMTGKRMRHLPVIEEGSLVGLISIGDVVKEIIDEQSFVIEQLESYIHS